MTYCIDVCKWYLFSRTHYRRERWNFSLKQRRTIRWEDPGLEYLISYNQWSYCCPLYDYWIVVIGADGVVMRKHYSVSYIDGWYGWFVGSCYLFLNHCHPFWLFFQRIGLRLKVDIMLEVYKISYFLYPQPSFASCFMYFGWIVTILSRCFELVMHY